ncbi:MAG: rhodanese-like domain-containing protein [Lewinellaceae bacterium]|nr:rhodanese-like domain-containing protein [Lewinellaceae bacterium]
MSYTNPISPREVYAKYMLGKSMFVDVRENLQPSSVTPALKNILHIPFSELESRMSELPADRPVVFLSWVGSRSHQAAQILSNKGYKVAHMVGGVQAWQNEGLPLTAE